jgi:hypothetical protein
MNNTKRSTDEILRDVFGKNLLDYLLMAGKIYKRKRPDLPSLLFSQVSAWISFFRGENEPPLWKEEDVAVVLPQIREDPPVIISFLEEIRAQFDEAQENDRLAQDFVLKYSRESDREQILEGLKAFTDFEIPV